MKACREVSKERGYRIEKVFRVPSKSEGGKYYIVQLFSNWQLECDCVAGSFKKPCRHKCIIAEKLAKVGIIVKR